jgi:branched-chain amino acid transport system permease protein
MHLSTLPQQLFNGLSDASVYALVAIGITVTFGLTRLINFAHGEIVTIGAYASWLIARRGGAGFLLGLLGAVIVTGLISLLLERTVFHLTIDKPINGFIVSLALILVIENLLVWKWTASPQHVVPAFSTVWQIAGIRISAMRAIVIVVTGLLLAALGWYGSRTWYGRAARAASMDREMLALTGVPVDRIITGTFVVGGMIAGLAGAFLGEINDITPFTGFDLIIKAFAVAIVGGLGSVSGAVVAAVMFGELEAVATALGAGAWIDSLLFAAMVIMVLVRPQGLMRGTEARVE